MKREQNQRKPSAILAGEAEPKQSLTKFPVIPCKPSLDVLKLRVKFDYVAKSGRREGDLGRA